MAHTHVAWGKALAQRAEKQQAEKQQAAKHFAKAAAQFATSGLTRELDDVRTLLGDGAANAATD